MSKLQVTFVELSEEPKRFSKTAGAARSGFAQADQRRRRKGPQASRRPYEESETAAGRIADHAGVGGFTYKTNLVWYKVRKDGGPDGRGVGFYFRNVTELVLFGVKGKLRTLAPGRRQVNVIVQRKREHSRKPGELYQIIEDCSPGPFLEIFARERVSGWTSWGDEIDSYVSPAYAAYTGSAANA